MCLQYMLVNGMFQSCTTLGYPKNKIQSYQHYITIYLSINIYKNIYKILQSF